MRNKRKSHSVVLYSSESSLEASPTAASVIGTADVDLLQLKTPIHLCFGNPDLQLPDEDLGGGGSRVVVWEDMHCHDRLKTNCYELSIDLGPSIGIKAFVWRRTRNDQNSNNREGKRILKKLDYLNLQMEDKETGVVLARFVHYPWAGWKRGKFEILEMVGDGERWVEICLLSGMATVEYLRKVWGLSF